MFIFSTNVKVSSLLCMLRSEEHTSELQSQSNLVCRLLLEKKKLTSSRLQPEARASRPCFRQGHKPGDRTHRCLALPQDPHRDNAHSPWPHADAARSRLIVGHMHDASQIPGVIQGTTPLVSYAMPYLINPLLQAQRGPARSHLKAIWSGSSPRKNPHSTIFFNCSGAPQDPRSSPPPPSPD